MQGHQHLSHCSCAEIIRLAIICPTYPPAMQLCKWKNLQVQITDAQPLDLLRIIPKLPSISGLRKPIKYDKLPRIICNQNTLDDVIIYCTCMFTDLYFRNQPNILIDIYIYNAWMVSEMFLYLQTSCKFFTEVMAKAKSAQVQVTVRSCPIH